MSIIIKGQYNDDPRLSKDYQAEQQERILAPLKKEALMNTFAIIINAKKEVPYKIRPEGQDKWYVGKCPKSSWERISKKAESITWEQYIEMMSSIPVGEKVRSQLYKALSGTGIFSITARTLTPIDHLPSTNNLTTNG